MRQCTSRTARQTLIPCTSSVWAWLKRLIILYRHNPIDLQSCRASHPVNSGKHIIQNIWQRCISDEGIRGMHNQRLALKDPTPTPTPHIHRSEKNVDLEMFGAKIYFYVRFQNDLYIYTHIKLSQGGKPPHISNGVYISQLHCISISLRISCYRH